MSKSIKDINSIPSIPENKESVDVKSWLKKDTHEDPRINSLMRIIRWQGRFIVLLMFVLVIAIAMPLLDIKFEIPNQTALNSAPPIDINAVDYNALAYQDAHKISNGETLSTPKITIIGQIFDGKEVLKQWPNIQFLVNNSNTPITGPNSQFKVNFNLHPGPNVIETSFRIDGVLYNRKQRVINYQPQPVTPTTTHETISTTTTIPTSR
jgi:hypothetical protein